jgi:Putative zinc-finger
MNCINYKLLISAQLDDELRPSERALLNHHLNECAACEKYATELRQQISSLTLLCSAALPAAQVEAMNTATMFALQVEARQALQKSYWRTEQKINFRIKIFSTTFATACTCVMFLVLVGSILRPAQQALSRASNLLDIATQVVIPDSNEELADLKDALLPMPTSPRPVLDPRGTLIGFANDVQDEDLTVIAWVGSDGKASVREVISAPNDPEIIAKLSTALTLQANFKPAFKGGKFTAANTVLMFSRITIVG